MWLASRRLGEKEIEKIDSEKRTVDLITQWLSEFVTKNTTPKGGHGLPHPFFLSWRFYISTWLAASPLRPDMVSTSLLVSRLPADSSPLEPSTH